MDTRTPSARPRQRQSPRPKPIRLIRLVTRPNGAIPGVVKITVAKLATNYFLSPLASDFGRGFLLEKIGDIEPGEDAAYQVCIEADVRRCTCKGYSRWQKCKHGDGLAELVRRGLI